MKYFSSRDKNYFVSSEQAIVGNLCPRGGLYMPEVIPTNKSIKNTLPEIGLQIAKDFLSDSFSTEELERICASAFNFPAPIVRLNDNLSVLELTHGPSQAFKDFGARFMAACLSQISERRAENYSVLTATSGDTGGAVAAALFNKPGVEVTILYPQRRISPYQEGQMTRWQGNVRTIAVNGSFDDCQRLVKEVFANPPNTRKFVSANSINIARLLAQMVYYLYAASEIKNIDRFVVPSGNLGNLTAGIFAAKYSAVNFKFIAAHNKNSAFVDYLSGGSYEPQPSKVSLSTAMDVGAPSNFERLECLFRESPASIKEFVQGVSIGDQATLAEMQLIFKEHGYISCPHTAVALSAARTIHNPKLPGQTIVLSTAAPIKFSEVLEDAGIKIASNTESIRAPTFAIEPDLDSLLKTFK